MDQNISKSAPENELDQLREAIALAQVLELNDHSAAYEEIHRELEEALRSIDGK